MTKSTRDEKMSKVAEVCKQSKTVKEIIGCGIAESTAYLDVKILTKRGILVEVSGYDSKGKPVKRYQNVEHKNIVDSKYLKIIIDNYKGGDKVRMEMAINDMLNLTFGSDKKILDKDFIAFICEEHIKKLDLSKYNSWQIWETYSKIVRNLRRDMDIHPEKSDEQKKLLKYIQNTVGEECKTIILDKSKDLLIKNSAFGDLREMSYPNLYNLVFDFLQIMTFPKGITEEDFYNFFFSSIKSLINDYSEIDLATCRIKLWNSHTAQKDERIKKSILSLLKTTSIGFNESLYYKQRCIDDILDALSNGSGEKIKRENIEKELNKFLEYGLPLNEAKQTVIKKFI